MVVTNYCSLWVKRRDCASCSNVNVTLDITIKCLLVQHIPGEQNHCADYMFRLADPQERCDSAERLHSVLMTETMPILASQTAKATEKDKKTSYCYYCCTALLLAI